MRILSIDVGVKNLGICELENSPDNNVAIGFWDVCSGTGQTDRAIQTAIAGAVDVMLELYERSGGGGWECVVIENQPCIKNPRMKAVQIAIHTFLVIHFGPDVNVCLAGAVGKNNIADKILSKKECAPEKNQDKETSGQKYRRAKKRSIAATREYLSSDERYAEHLAAMENSSKKDDMCDSFLQGLYYLSSKAKLLTI